MAIVALQKIAITWHKDVQSAVIDFLHKEGVLHISHLGENSIDALESPVLFTKADLEYCYNTLIPYADKNTKRGLHSQKNTDEQVQQTMKQFDFLGLIDELRLMEANDTELIARRSELKAISERIELWSNYPYNLEQNTQTDFTKTMIGIVQNNTATDFLDAIKDKPMHATVLQQTESITCIVCTILQSDEQSFNQIGQAFGWQQQELPSGTGPIRVFKEENTLELLQIEKKLQQHDARRRELSLELRKVSQAITFVNWLNEKHTALKATIQTGETMTITGWMPKKDVHSFETKLHRHFASTSVTPIKADAGEEPPIYLKNPLFLTPFESVTTLFGLPNNSETDPTISLSPFFIIFFSLCLTDAGYGAALAIIMGLYLWIKKLTIKEARLPWLLFYSGLVTIPISIPFGGWFGLMPTEVPAMFTKTMANGEILFKGQIWNLGAQTGITFLQNLSLVLGIIHLFYGMYIAGSHKWKHGKKAEAFWVDFTSHILLASILFFAFGPTSYNQTALYCLYASIALLIWGKGYGSSFKSRPFMGLLMTANFSLSMMSNVLSYLRILALGLVTGALALAVNQVAIEFSKFFPSFLHIPAIIVIAFVGHMVSITLNTLGAFIHSGRLQFIEFFSQFFTGGGRPFSPFKRSL